MKVSEKRTQVYFPKELYDRLENEAKKENNSVASLIRKATEEYLSNKKKEVDWDNDPIWNLVGFAESKEGDWSERHDFYLYGLDKKRVRGKKWK